MNGLTDRKVYISGPISGNENAVFDFIDAEIVLRLNGFDNEKIFNPHFFCWLHNITAWIKCMAVATEELHKCDILCRLPGWENSPGARIENAIAKQRGLVICDLVGNTLKLDENFLNTKEL